MSYTLFFLLGIPFWLIPAASIFRSESAVLPDKTAWAAMAFLAPFLIFSLGAVGNVLVQQRFDADGAGARGFGYFIVLLNIVAFFSPFAVQSLFRVRHASREGRRPH